MSSYHLDHLQYLETEAIHIMREVAAEFETSRPATSPAARIPLCLLRLAEKSISSCRTCSDAVSERRELAMNFPSCSRIPRPPGRGAGKNSVRTVDEAIAKGQAQPAPGEISRNKLQIPVLLGGAVEEFQFDCAIGGCGAMREKARAKERFFSFRDSFGQWDPKNQRPEDLESL